LICHLLACNGPTEVEQFAGVEDANVNGTRRALVSASEVSAWTTFESHLLSLRLKPQCSQNWPPNQTDESPIGRSHSSATFNAS